MNMHVPRARRRKAWLAALAGAVGVLVLAAGADRYVAHGMRATWRTPHEGEPAIVAHTVEHRIEFPNRYRAVSRYIQGWPFERWEIPDHLPPFDATLEGRLRVPSGPARLIRARSPNEVRLHLDGASDGGESVRAEPGEHDLQVHWSGDFEPEASLQLLWGPDEQHLAPVPRTALTPPEGPWTPSRTILWTAAALCALLLAFALVLVMRPLERRRRLRRMGALGIVLLVLAGIGWRAWDHAVMPEHTENYDELFALWNGWQLLEDGTTRGWSLWPYEYGDMVEVEKFRYFRKRPFRIVRPYFEHPPLFHLAVGGVAHLTGAESWQHVRLETTRWVPILLGGLTVALVVLLGRRLYPNSATPWLGGLLYAVLPTIALQGRVIKEEALLVPLALGSLLFFLRWRDEGEQPRDLIGASVLAGLCPFVKGPGIFFIATLVVLVAMRRRLRAALLVAGIGLALTGLVFVYGAIIDWEVFWYATVRQSVRRATHWNLYPRFFDDSLINHNAIGHGWLLFLWFSYFLAVARSNPRTTAVLLIPPLLYLVPLGLASGNWTFGWYWMPLYPFLCLAGGRLIEELWTRPGLLRGFVFVAFLLMYSLNFTLDPDYARDGANGAAIRRMVTVFLIPALVPFGLSHLWPSAPTRALAKTITAAGLALFVVVSGMFVVRYDAIYEDYYNFDKMEFFDR